MSELIYEPTGKAREYSPLALNVYTGGCDHGCEYCFCKGIGSWGLTAKPRKLKGLEDCASRAKRQVMLSFMSDPYCLAELKHRDTRFCLGVLSTARCSVAILSKGGNRCLEDLSTFQAWPDGRVKVGATLTFLSRDRSLAMEPGAASPDERLDTLRQLHEAGIKTWASIEPVIDEKESLAVIARSLPFVDGYKVGKLNHRKSNVDWSSFCVKAVSMIRGAGRVLYVKDDLRPFAPAGFLRPKECNPETVFLQDRSSLNDTNGTARQQGTIPSTSDVKRHW